MLYSYSAFHIQRDLQVHPEMWSNSGGITCSSHLLCLSRLPVFKEEDKRLVKGTYDFFAISHFSTDLVTHAKEDSYDKLFPRLFVRSYTECSNFSLTRLQAAFSKFLKCLIQKSGIDVLQQSGNRGHFACYITFFSNQISLFYP